MYNVTKWWQASMCTWLSGLYSHDQSGATCIVQLLFYIIMCTICAACGLGLSDYRDSIHYRDGLRLFMNKSRVPDHLNSNFIGFLYDTCQFEFDEIAT